MKKGIIVLAVIAAVTAWAADVNCKNAWRSGSIADPSTRSPKDLVDELYPILSSERNKMNALEDGWGLNHTYWYEDGGNYNWILLYFESYLGDIWSEGTTRFKAKVESNNVVKLYAWDGGGSWVKLAQNAGGNNPSVVTDIVIDDYIMYQEDDDVYTVIILLSGANASPHNEMWCDVCDIDAE